jgi:hypothetical protein
MNPANGHAQKDPTPAFGQRSTIPEPEVLPITAERIKEFVAALEVPFDASQIEWRVMNTPRRTGSQRVDKSSRTQINVHTRTG